MLIGFVALKMVNIKYIRKNEWKTWGITNYMHRTNLHKHVQNLINQNNDNGNQCKIASAQNVNINYNEGGNMTEYH